MLFDNFKKIKMNGPLKIGLKTKNGYDHLCFIQILNTYNIKFKNNDSKQKITIARKYVIILQGAQIILTPG